MSRHRHMMKRAKGGMVYSGSGSNVVKEAEEKHQRKHGGRVHEEGKMHGHKAKHRLDKKARGGSVKKDEKADKKMSAKMVHKHEKHMHKGEKETKFARGGRVGSDASPMAPGSARHPFTSAAR